MNKKVISFLMLCLAPIALLAGSGDVNGDGLLNAADIVEIANYLNGTPSDNFNDTEADVSGNGAVDETDIKIIKQVIMDGDVDLTSAIEYYALQEKISEAQEKIDELNEQVNQIEPKLQHFEFLASENPLQLVENSEGDIFGDHSIECRILNFMSAKTLIPRFSFTGDYVTIGGKVAESSKTAFDFSAEQTLVVHAGEKTKEYTVTVSAYTGLPTLWAETKNRKLKEANLYYDATIKLVDNVKTKGKGGLAETSGKIMAEGTLRYYTKTVDWSGETEWGKNDYKLKFNKAVSLLKMPSNTEWILMPNVNDITMLHNQTAFSMSKMSSLEYTPRYQYVDLMFNGRYTGTYLLGETLRASSSTIDVGSDGFLMNIGSNSSVNLIYSSQMGAPISILYPSSPSTAEIEYIRDNVVRKAENVLFSTSFTNETSGWQKYLDASSFVDWYLINEIAKNENSALKSDCIMSYKRGGKLKMGPVWNFETAFGNDNKTSAKGFVIKGAVKWYNRLFQDPIFVAMVKERFNYFYTHQADIVRDINENAQYLMYAIQEDDKKWDTFKSEKSSNSDTWVLYQGHVSKMKTWLAERMKWLKGQFDAMEGARNAERERWNAEQTLRNEEQAILSSSGSSAIDYTELNGQLRLMWEDLQQRIEDLEKVLDDRQGPQLLSLEFLTDDNSTLRGDVTGKIVGDSIIECWLPGISNNKVLKPRFTFEGTMVVIDGYEAVSGKTKIDFTKPRKLAVVTSNKNKYYTVYVHSHTGLPIMTITTDGNKEVTSKDVYIGANLVLKEDVKTRAAGDVIEKRVNIKGRGNSSWKFAKKPFTLKFDEKVSLLDMNKDKSWVLIPNYNDKSMIRNSLAFYMSSISNMDYTPESHFIELIFNGKYWGTYLLCEKLKIAKHRVNVGDNGFLMEIDSRAPGESDSRYFEVSHLENVVNIKDPDVEYNDANFNYIKEFVKKADGVLFGSNYKDSKTGWQAYLDMDSFVDWYLIQEIGKNLDGIYDTSCYMHLARGGKLMMGPMWDMDVAFGNIDQANQTCYIPTGFYIKDVQWYTRLFTDPVFVKRVKERFNYFNNHLNDILANINADAQYLRYSAEENNNVWGVLNVKTWPNYNIWGSYQNEVQDVKEWLVTRMKWLKTQFDKM